MKRFRCRTYSPQLSRPIGLDARIPAALSFIVGAIAAWLNSFYFLAALVPLLILVFERESSMVRMAAAHAFINGLVLSVLLLSGDLIHRQLFRTVMSSNFRDINLSIYETAMTVIVVIRQLIGWLMAALTALQLWHIYFNTVWLMPLTGRLSERLADIIDCR